MRRTVISLNMLVMFLLVGVTIWVIVSGVEVEQNIYTFGLGALAFIAYMQTCLYANFLVDVDMG